MVSDVTRQSGQASQVASLVLNGDPKAASSHGDTGGRVSQAEVVLQ